MVRAQDSETPAGTPRGLVDGVQRGSQRLFAEEKRGGKPRISRFA